MSYLELKIKLNSSLEDSQTISEILVSELADAGFESFSETESEINAYIPKKDFSENLIPLEFLNLHGLSYETKIIPKENWNQKWEENFEPVFIANQVYIHASFHPEKPDAAYSLLINPKMSFGTGHHATTELMVKEILRTDLNGKSVLDMGTGTGILALLAFKRGASEICTTEIEEFALENCRENFHLNGLEEFTLIDFNRKASGYGKFDVLIANINKNILLAQVDLYQDSLIENGKLMMSGFYEEDLDDIRKMYESKGFEFVDAEVLNKWCRASFNARLYK